MRLPVRLGEIAETQLWESYRWYEERSKRAANRFMAEVERVLVRIAKNPFRFEAVERGTRQAKVSRFPYIVVFVPRESHIKVVAVLHTSRDRETWLQRPF